MKNTLTDLNNYLFEAIERLNDDSLDPDGLEKEIRRSEAVTKVAQTIIENGEMAIRAQKVMYEYGHGGQVEIPLLGITEKETQKKKQRPDGREQQPEGENQKTGGLVIWLKQFIPRKCRILFLITMRAFPLKSRPQDLMKPLGWSSRHHRSIRIRVITVYAAVQRKGTHGVTARRIPTM